MKLNQSLATLIASAALVAPLAARAEFGPNPGLELAVRTGFVLPFGNIVGTSNNGTATTFSDSFTGFIPFVLEAGWRFTPHLMVGANFQFGYGLVKGCDQGSCSGNEVSLGVEVLYHFAPLETFDPWVGVGSGYEWLNVSGTSNGTTVDIGARGFQFINVQFGVEFPVARSFSLGPYVQFALGQYSSATINQTSGDITNTALHEFLTFGFRGTLDL